MGVKRRSSAPAATDYLDDDDDTVTTLRSKRRKDEDAAPAKKKKVVVVDEDENEDEDEEEERPRRKVAKKPAKVERDEDDLDDDDEEEDEDAVPDRSSLIQPGWAAAKRVMAASRPGFADEFRFGDQPALVKFMADEPFGSFNQHWIERQGKRSFVCLQKDPKGCPLCKAGDSARSITAFNIAVFHEDGDVLTDPVVKALHAGPRLLNQITAEHEGRYGPLTTHYWLLSRTGKKGSYSTGLKVVKERDLEEDWEVDPDLARKQLKKLKPYDPSIFKLPTRKELIDIAREMNEGD